MIEYLEIVNKIKDIKENAIEDFNKQVCIPLALSNLDFAIKEDNGKIIIEKNEILVEIDLESRDAFSEIIGVLKNLNRDLYNKIDYKYIDFFEKFKDINYSIDFSQDFNNIELKFLTLEILAMFNLKFWCEDDIERKKFLENMRIIVSNNEVDDLKQNDEANDQEEKEEINIQEILPEEFENLEMIKNNWWINLLNKIRNFRKGL